MPELLDRIAEVIEAGTTGFTAQCYELYQLPPLGSLVKTGGGTVEQYGIIYNAETTGIDPNRNPIARGKDEATEEEIYRTSPQLLKLLRSEFSALIVGHRDDDKLFHYLPPTPARIHGFVYRCGPEETREFSRSLDFLNILLNANLPVSVDELAAATLRQMGQSQKDRDVFMVAAGKELATLLSGQYALLKSILRRLK
jgi:hypothetical protein